MPFDRWSVVALLLMLPGSSWLLLLLLITVRFVAAVAAADYGKKGQGPCASWLKDDVRCYRLVDERVRIPV